MRMFVVVRIEIGMSRGEWESGCVGCTTRRNAGVGVGGDIAGWRQTRKTRSEPWKREGVREVSQFRKAEMGDGHGKGYNKKPQAKE